MALQKLQCFFTKVMSPYHFFDGSGPKFFCRVNGLLRMVKRPTELEEQRKLFGFKPQSHTISTFTSSVSLPSRLKRLKNGSGKVFIPIRNTWTHKFFLCASSMCSQVPTR